MSRPTSKWLMHGLNRRLRGRNRIEIRAIRPDDRERLVRAFCALDQRSIYQRFFFAKRELADKELRQVTESDGVRTVVLVATIGSGTQEAIVGLGQYARHGTEAQVAFAIDDDFRGHGIATRLMRHLIRIARERGIERLEADVLADNWPMLAVLHHAGLPLRESEADGVVHATLLLSDPLQGHCTASLADCD